MTVPSIPRLTMNDGRTIPQLGFGVYLVPPEETERVVTDALEVGYRHLDTAAYYGNEAAVGAAIARSGIPRDEIFVTTKLWFTDLGHDRAHAAIDRSLERLGLDRVDLYLIHWPVPPLDLFVETWRAFDEIRAAGKASSIGVSNFREVDIRRLLDETGTAPAVNQVELHPLFVQRELRDYDAGHGILTESWGPLGRGVLGLLDQAPVADAAAAHGVAPAQVVIRWHLQHDLVVIPKSGHRDRMRQNIDVFDFELTVDEVAAIDALDRGVRTGADPATAGA